MNDTTQNSEIQKRVVIVDDDQFLLDMYTVKFKEAGFTVVGLTESSAALDYLRENKNPDALLLDLIMPEIDGFELMRQVREEGLAGDKTAVIVLTNQGQDADMDNAKQYAIDGYLIKASTVPSEVLSYVNRAIEKKQTA